MHDIHSICPLLKNCSISKIIITPSFIQKAAARKYHEGFIKQVFQEKKLVGIIDQDDATFKITYEHTDSRDLVLDCRIEQDHIRPITVYPAERTKRIRREEQ